MTPALKEWLTQLLQLLEVLAVQSTDPEAEKLLANLKEELNSPINWGSE
jgi:hypothetical protein